jgi:hypothetical protein
MQTQKKTQKETQTKKRKFHPPLSGSLNPKSQGYSFPFAHPLPDNPDNPTNPLDHGKNKITRHTNPTGRAY